MPKSKRKRCRNCEWEATVEFLPNLSANGSCLLCKGVITAVELASYSEKVMAGNHTHTLEQKVQASDGHLEKVGS